jgi:hypothetical protein
MYVYNATGEQCQVCHAAEVWTFAVLNQDRHVIRLSAGWGRTNIRSDFVVNLELFGDVGLILLNKSVGRKGIR